METHTALPTRLHKKQIAGQGDTHIPAYQTAQKADCLSGDTHIPAYLQRKGVPGHTLGFKYIQSCDYVDNIITLPPHQNYNCPGTPSVNA